MRIGHGFDVHRLVTGRPLILGGVTIDHSHGLLGHSDADVVLHALCDALLGALGRGDIGQYFPDTDESFEGADSRVLLRRVATMMLADGYTLGNADLTIVAQAPKLMTYLAQMRQNIAADLNSDEADINLKATTTEELGYVGQKEGIAAHAVVLLENYDY